MNEEKFSGMADVYSKYRPTYSDIFVEYLYNEVGLNPNSVIADIGSGTGKLTKILLQKGNVVYAVEPNDDMRSAAENNFNGNMNFISVNAAAEHTGLSDKSVDFITVAQAFHWFDIASFKLECSRILKDNGKVIIVYNSRDSKSQLVIENDAINHKYCPHFKGFSGGGRGLEPHEYADFFAGGLCEYKKFKSDLEYNEDEFVGRNLSASYGPKASDENYSAYVNELKMLFQKYSINGVLCMPNFTVSYVGNVK